MIPTNPAPAPKSPLASVTIWLAVAMAVIPLLVQLLTAYGVDAKVITPAAEFILAVIVIVRRLQADPTIPPAALTK